MRFFHMLMLMSEAAPHKIITSAWASCEIVANTTPVVCEMPYTLASARLTIKWYKENNWL